MGEMMDYLITSLCVVLGVYLLATQPVSVTMHILTLPVPNKGEVVRCMWNGWLASLLALAPALLAPVVVPIALVFTRWEADKLPALFRWWDNDVSINGDVRKQDLWDLAEVPIEDNGESCYWAPGHHPRSFWARFVWLGLRNRASWLSKRLGYTYGEWDTYSVYGDHKTDRGHEGWVIRRAGKHYQYYYTKRLGKYVFRSHYGYKISLDGRLKEASLVAISASLLSWTGKAGS